MLVVPFCFVDVYREVEDGVCECGTSQLALVSRLAGIQKLS